MSSRACREICACLERMWEKGGGKQKLSRADSVFLSCERRISHFQEGLVPFHRVMTIEDTSPF